MPENKVHLRHDNLEKSTHQKDCQFSKWIKIFQQISFQGSEPPRNSQRPSRIHNNIKIKIQKTSRIHNNIKIKMTI